ncbi:DNA mismatch repair protein MutL [Robertmurraya siralis]|uniref:DNA mismatch repair protein MutL n=1 Tax=Robertmurraya siralis TaxID=77777 RepID=A0A919WGL8_9BACI|nr:DNA mismatch repair endonuclease MutL [Robertmurraya siralis]PAE21477.1 DNA mismatch repair endonuclease MutL [Bacillus sp. 7504-2]GIN61620.1 DNA mismatch repair protein MutL [Robertmurraya siralis]
MGKIIQLDDLLSNKIAAGEVVERPASVVKELVENALDANSTIIEIEVEEAGLAKIRITDNGDGIEESDVLMAFQRHATSKIKNDQDLFRIRTLGFRGEALPSIASVSRIEIKTSTGEEGTRLVLEGGHVEIFEKASSRKGTDIIVTDLFFNTPARLKYMKTVHTELGNITDIVNRLALSHPEVSFRLIHNDRKLLHTNGNGDVRQVLAAIYGLNIVKKMIPIEATSLDFTIRGWLALPEITRASRNYITTMVNGRFIKNYPLVKSIQEGYHTLLPIGRFPIALLNVEMDPILVDVNVHPSKMEVRFSKEAELNHLVTETIKNAFHQKELIPEGLKREPKQVERSEQPSFDFEHLPVAKEAQPTFSFEEMPQVEVQETIRELPSKPVESNAQPAIEEEMIAQTPATVSKDEANVESRVPPLYPIGQMHGTYILAQNEKGLYIIDQHAAQERIKYEYFREKVGQVESELQEMLVPLTFEYSADEAIKIMEHKEQLEEVGVFLEPFGINSFIARSHPQWFPTGLEKEIIEEMLEQLLTMKKVDIKKLREEAAIMMSCKASIKANHYLQMSEIQALLDQLRRSSDPFTCPHGRPIIIHYSTYEMEKMFKRVM